MAKRKAKTIAQEVEVAAKLLQKLVRMKASDDNGYCQCVTCGKIDHYKAMQGGHFIPRGRTRLKLMTENVHPQCPHCNQWGMKQAHYVLRYREYMVDTYGERRVRAMEKLAWMPPPKFNRQDILDLQKDLKEQIKEQEKRINVY
tara:strand:+ start:757 stop:1188 length:432 start_codon:yes stop_codon:yes gene_type:complete